MKDFNTSVRKSSVWMIVRLGVSLMVGTFITTFVIRKLSVEEYGIYNILYSLIGYISVLGSFGIPEVFRRFIPEAFQKKDYSLLKQLVLRGLILRVLLSVLIVSIIFFLSGPIGHLLKLQDFLEYYVIFAFGIVIYLEASLLTNVLHSLFLHKYSVIASTIHTLFRGVCVFLLLKFGWGIRGVLVAEVVAWGLWAILQGFFYYVKFIRKYPTEGCPSLPLRRYLRYGGFSSLNELGSSILGVSTDFFIITAFLGPGAVALYAFADRVLRLLVNCMPHIILVDVIRPTFFVKYAENGDKKQLANMFNLLLKLEAFCVFPLVMGVFVLSDKIITFVFKPDYLPCQPILWILLISLVINIFATPSGLVLLCIERVDIGFYSKIFAFYNLIVEIFVIQIFGVVGVVVVTCSAVLMKNLFSFYFMKKYSGVAIQWIPLLLISCNSIVMSITIWFLRPLVSGLFSLVAMVIFGICIFLVCSFLNKVFDDQERKWLNKVLPKPIFCF